MSKISREEVIKIAALSSIALEEHKINALVEQLESVLSYAQRVTEIAADADEQVTKNINIFRDDVIVSFDASTVMKEAPERDQNYFVVPKIVDGSR
ncbi:Asp-tRNA(Asn)/Glu-tRNA(Gln) amidotransferase subunit GatC [Candidatus Dependentiae bacterium]|nr:Asp-tRNA(Asn)/Glu-tRNA(Gln) amidotransferase subunit GatC [Candidatus Dependentiae bacterium]MCC7414712.1 Asp-tRNA(Asn)/Glu-tRNA(Gln) amidotransferase subunit GatC [Campylobacterota bacterium]